MSSVSLLTDWRVSLKGVLQTTFPTATVYDGERPNKLARDRMVICVFADAMTEWSPDANMAQPTMTIRIWCPFPRNTIDVPRNPEPLETAMMELALALQQVLVTLDGPDFFKVTSIEPDYLVEYGIQANLVGWTRSPMMTGG